MMVASGETDFFQDDREITHLRDARWKPATSARFRATSRAASLWSGVARCDVLAAAHLGRDDFGLLLAFQEQPQERQEH
jgi:hypothetical protein